MKDRAGGKGEIPRRQRNPLDTRICLKPDQGPIQLHSAIGYRTPQEALDEYLDRQAAA